ncbi:hypothetical protein CR152_23475 [Massilia violaceinigra]|uniref:Uncharacterized protein n=1 Tax=Massilia violaceinigra TaxID=2045208 RepID=A0A2D2DQ88_9BURK|nr:hypothetical protein [Massilia violaceinigra]ATQ77146.1 hypothetical protein CR152_23475 [Massilia violaceinigra]
MDTPQITPLSARSAGLIAPLAPTHTVAIEQVQSLPLAAVAPTTVDLSTSGRFLSLASLFQKKMLDLQNAVAADTDASKQLADVTVAAAAVASIFNELQTSVVDNTGAAMDTLGDQSLQSQFFQQFGGTPQDADASLAAIGLSFTPATSTTPGTLRMDETALQDAFGRDPVATSALLERAANAFFGVVSTQVQAQAAGVSFLSDDSVIGAAPRDFNATPSQAASNADNLFVQNLVAETLREESALLDERATGVPPFLTQTDLGEGRDFPVQMDLIASPETEALAVGARVASLPADPDAQAIAANATLVEALATPIVAAAPTALAMPPAPAAPPVAATLSTEDRTQSASSATTPATATISGPDTTASNAISVAEQARVLAQQLQAEREAARELDEKIAGASDAVRAALADDIAKRDALRVDQLNVERSMEQRRADQLAQAGAAPVPVAPDQFPRPAAAVSTVTTAQTVAQDLNEDPNITPQQAPLPAPNQAQLAARDPAIAAAIAAYNVNTGPFAAQNGRPDIQPPKAKPVAPVAGVTKVEPAGALGTPGDGSSPLR